MEYAKDYVLLRDVVGRQRYDVPRCPMQVLTVYREERFLKDGHILHKDTVLIEDRYHDWQWENGKFYFTRLEGVPLVALVYSTEYRSFCAHCGVAVVSEKFQLHCDVCQEKLK